MTPQTVEVEQDKGQDDHLNHPENNSGGERFLHRRKNSLPQA